MEKVGAADFRIEEGARKLEVDNKQFLTPVQEKMMSTQPDMILQYAHYLEAQYLQEGWENPQVYADVFVTLNGSSNKRFIDPKVDLTSETDSWENKEWVLDYE